MKTSSFALSAFAAVVLLGTAALAEDTAPAQATSAAVADSAGHHHRWEGRMACRADVKKLCADVRIGDGFEGIKTCLASHETELSAPCSAHITQMKAMKAAFDTACGADVQSLCAEARVANKDESMMRIHGVMRCLSAHKTELSDTCKTFRAAQKSEHHEWMHHEQAE